MNAFGCFGHERHVGAGRSGPHLEEALLAAYAARQVDPARRAAFTAHLEGCPECRARLARVKALGEVLREAPRSEPDELAWRRLRDRVRSKLEAEARQMPTTQDLVARRRWAAVGLAAVFAVAAAVWIVPRRPPRPPPASGQAAATRASESRAPLPVLASGSTQLDATLASGLRLRLAPDSRVEPMGVQDGEEVLVLRSGEVGVFAAVPRSETPVVRVETSRFAVRGPSRSFRVGFWADRYRVEVQNGRLQGTGGPFGEGEMLEAGSVRNGSFERVVARAGQPAEPTDRAAGEKPAISARTKERSTPPAARVTDVPARVDQVETQVEVVKPPSDPATEALRQAEAAYYQTRDLVAATRWARRAIQSGGDGPKAQRARRLLCDIYVASRRPRQAVRACRAALEGATAERRRILHYTLATVLRTQLADCRSAIEHYNQALVFGAKSVLDDDVRLFRAKCALAVGDRDLAARDVSALEARSGWLARPEELETLKRQMRDGSQTGEPSAVPFKNDR